MCSESLFSRDFELEKKSGASMSFSHFTWEICFLVGIHFDYSKVSFSKEEIENPSKDHFQIPTKKQISHVN